MMLNAFGHPVEWWQINFSPLGVGVLPYVSYIGMCGAKGYGF